MKIQGNTILVTGGGSGIGRALAEALQKEGNTVIIAGRRKAVLDEVTNANPGMKSIQLDIENPQAIAAFAKEVTTAFPSLNVVINNAGIMRPEKLTDANTADAEAMITTNLLGPIRLTAALLPHLQKQSSATVINVTSGLAFIPLTMTPTYCATKAAIHSYTQSLRHQLKDTKVEVLELPPPYVQTELMGQQQASDPRAMPLGEFISEVVQILKTNPTPAEILVERVKPLRYAERQDYAAVFTMLNSMAH